MQTVCMYQRGSGSPAHDGSSVVLSRAAATPAVLDVAVRLVDGSSSRPVQPAGPPSAPACTVRQVSGGPARGSRPWLREGAPGGCPWRRFPSQRGRLPTGAAVHGDRRAARTPPRGAPRRGELTRAHASGPPPPNAAAGYRPRVAGGLQEDECRVAPQPSAGLSMSATDGAAWAFPFWLAALSPRGGRPRWVVLRAAARGVPCLVRGHRRAPRSPVRRTSPHRPCLPGPPCPCPVRVRLSLPHPRQPSPLPPHTLAF